jgi:peptidyl-prolyl cis-trans isomerase SurA
MKRIVLLAATALLLTALPVGAQIVSRIAAIVNDEIITTGQLDREVEKRLTKESKGQPLSDELRNELRKELLPQLIEDTLINQRAKKLGIEIRPEEVDQAIEDVQRQNGISREQLKEALVTQGVTYDEYRIKLASQLLNFKLVGREIRSEVEVTNQELRDYLQKHLEDFRQAPYIRLSRISFLVPAGEDADQVAALRSLSREALQRLRGGEPFAEVLAAYSGSKGAEGGAMGTFGEGELTEPFAGAVSGLATGEVSEVVDTPQGFHLLYMEEKNPGRVPAFEEVKDQLSKLILERKRQEALEGWAKKLRDEAHIEIKL